MLVKWTAVHPGAWINIKTSYQYRKSHCGDETILRPSYLHSGIAYTGKTASLYWFRAQVPAWVNPMTPVLVNVTGSVWHRFTSILSTMYYPSSLHQEDLDIIAASFFHPQCPLFPTQLKAMPARWATVMQLGRLFVYDVNKMLPRKPCCLCSLLLTQFICHRSWSLSQKLANKHSKCWWFSYHDMMFWEQVEIYHMQLQVWYFLFCFLDETTRVHTKHNPACHWRLH